MQDTPTNDRHKFWPYTNVSRSEDPRVQAIRRDPVIGFGTCSVVDECYDDADLIERLDEAGAISNEEAVRYFRFTHDVYEDVANDIRNA